MGGVDGKPSIEVLAHVICVPWRVAALRTVLTISLALKC